MKNNNTFRWKKPVEDQEEYNSYVKEGQLDRIGGLEIFLNLEKVHFILFWLFLFNKKQV